MNGTEAIKGKSSRYAMREALVAALVVGIIVGYVLIRNSVTLNVENNDLYRFILIPSSLISSTIIALLVFRRFIEPPKPFSQQWFNTVYNFVTRVGYAATFGCLWLIIATITVTLMGQSLGYPILSPFTAVIFALGAGVIAYLVSYTSSSSTTAWLLIITLIVLTLGLLLAILFQTILSGKEMPPGFEGRTWRDALSILGIGPYGFVFTLTFALSGLNLLTVLQDKLGDLRTLQDDGKLDGTVPFWLRLLVTVLCASFALIGIIPTDKYPVAHMISAIVAFASFIINVLLTFRILHFYPVGFKRYSFAIIFLCVLAIVLFVLKWISLTQLELIFLILSIAWFGPFYANTRAYIYRKDHRLITGSIPVNVAN